MTKKTDVIVVGAGLAGLSAGARMAQQGLSVLVLEGTSRVGGLGRSEKRGPYTFNVGQHALYRRGPGARVLGELGVEVSGGVPTASGGFGIFGGRLHTLPAGFMSLLTCGFLSPAEKLQVGRLFATLPSSDLDAVPAQSVAQWLDGQRLGPGARALLEGFVRLTSYGAMLEALPARIALRQLQMGLTSGVLYLHGGWDTMVTGLARKASDAGCEIHDRARVRQILVEDGAVHGVRMDDGSTIRAPQVLMAVPPKVAAQLVRNSECLHSMTRAALRVPLRLSCLTVGLTHLPNPRATFALGVDEPTYVSVHSAAANLADGDRALVCASRYLQPDEPGATREQLGALLERIQPRWQDHLEESQFLPQIVVAHGGRFGGPEIPDVRGLWVAGDWVGREGLLADASLASGALAADETIRHHRGDHDLRQTG